MTTLVKKQIENRADNYSCLFSVLTGQLNYLGASHQLWHVLVVVMFYWWHQTAIYIMNYRHSQPCSSG